MDSRKPTAHRRIALVRLENAKAFTATRHRSLPQRTCSIFSWHATFLDWFATSRTRDKDPSRLDPVLDRGPSLGQNPYRVQCPVQIAEQLRNRPPKSDDTHNRRRLRTRVREPDSYNRAFRIPRKNPPRGLSSVPFQPDLFHLLLA